MLANECEGRRLGDRRSEALRKIERTASGGRIYVEDDFYWDDDTSKFKPQIVATVNKIARENRNCRQVDASSIAKSTSRSKPEDPVFFVTCGSGPNVFNVWFRPTDVAAGETFAAKEPLGKRAAVDTCERAAKQATVHPSTVEFSRVWDLAYMPHVSGRARVVSTFAAKDARNEEFKYRIDCLLDGPTLIETSIAESFDWGVRVELEPNAVSLCEKFRDEGNEEFPVSSSTTRRSSSTN